MAAAIRTQPGWRRARLVAVLAFVAAVAGCGIPVDSAPEVVVPPPPYGLPTTTPPPTEDRATGPLTVTLYLTMDNRVVPVQRSVETQPTVKELLDQLTAGPTREELAQGYGTALVAGTDVIAGVGLDRGMATVALTPDGLDGVAPVLQPFAVAQIVCTLDAHPDVTSVVFTSDGQRASVPRGDASQTTNPLTTEDYASLLEAAD